MHKIFTVAMISASFAFNSASAEAVELLSKRFEMIEYTPLKLRLRAGYIPEKGALKGCVLYLQGLADSIQNHDPYFTALSGAGYRILTFDYMGQGGSEGKMNDTRVQAQLPPHATSEMKKRHEISTKYQEIPEQAEFVWNHYKDVKNEQGQDCNSSKKLVIGWSTGGLAGYRMAHEKRADAVVLLAPGIHPYWMVGESSKNPLKMIALQQTITEQTLTRNKFENSPNPHVDPIKPKSPAHSPQFAGNLVGVANGSQGWTIPSSVRGLVLLSGFEDTYVDREATQDTLRKNAPHFKVQAYDGALHELDNELPEVANDVRDQTIKFFDSVTGS